jgi:hypothetical protein
MSTAQLETCATVLRSGTSSHTAALYPSRRKLYMGGSRATPTPTAPAPPQPTPPDRNRAPPSGVRAKSPDVCRRLLRTAEVTNRDLHHGEQLSSAVFGRAPAMSRAAAVMVSMQQISSAVRGRPAGAKQNDFVHRTISAGSRSM